MKKSIKIIVILNMIIGIFIAFCLFSTRTNTIVSKTWKQTSQGELGTGILIFDEESSYKYKAPLIKRNDKYIGVILIRIKGHIITFSLTDYSLIHFQSI